ncbi:hypothetical protein PENSPDRAFT_691971 [Peniophora sp. CONT]|nr:hypothetical protein PENSPDRAFT_691971 [Peniophora sp. CONT]
MQPQADTTALSTCNHGQDGLCEHWTDFLDSARKHLALRDLFRQYWRFRREEPVPNSDVSDRAYTELLAVAIEIYAFINSYQLIEGFFEGTPDDPKAFWSFAQPSEEATDDLGTGIIEVFVEILTDDDFFRTPPAFIDHVLWGFSALIGLGEHRVVGVGRTGDAIAASAIIVHTASIFKHFWDNRCLIKVRPQCERDAEGYGDDSVEPMHDQLGRFPEPFSRLFESISFLYDFYLEHLEKSTPKQRALAPKYPRYRDTYMPYVGLHVWISGNAQLVGCLRKDMAIIPISTMLKEGDVAPDEADVKRIAVEAIVNGVGADAFFTQFKRAMQQLDDAEYGYDEIPYVHAAVILARTEEISPYLKRHDILQPLVRLLNFQARALSPDRLAAWIFICSFFDPATERLLDACKRSEGTLSAPLMRGEDIVDFMARGADLLSEWNPFCNSSVDLYKRQLIKFASCYTSLVRNTADYHGTGYDRAMYIIDGMRARAPSQWLQSLKRLRDAQKRGWSYAEVIRSWRIFGIALGLDQVAEEERYRGRDLKLFCSLSRCEYHTERPPKSLSCKGCGEVKYCSRLCQVRHWKEEHKKRCGDRLPPAARC